VARQGTKARVPDSKVGANEAGERVQRCKRKVEHGLRRKAGIGSIGSVEHKLGQV